MRAVMMALGLVVLLAIPVCAGEPPIDDLVTEAKAHVHDYSPAPEDSIGGFIEKALASGTGGAELISIVGKRFELKEGAARLIVVAELRDVIADRGAIFENESEIETINRAAEELYAAALRSAPANSAVAREYLVVVARFPKAGLRIRDVLRGLPVDQRGTVALQVMNDSRVTVPDDALAEAATESLGLDPIALSIVAESLPDAEAELFDRASELWLAQNDIQSASVAAGRAIQAYADRRSLDDVLRIYRRMPPEARAMLAKEPSEVAIAHSHGVERSIRTSNVRATLAAAFVLAGDSRTALRILENGNDMMSTVIRAAVDPPPGDAFDLITSYLQHTDDKATGLVDEVFARMAARAGYPAIGKWRLARVTQMQTSTDEDRRASLPREIAALLRPLPSAALSDEPVISPGAARFLGAKRLAAFVERPVDDSARSVERQCGAVELQSSGVKFPSGFYPVRSEAQGNEIVAVGESQDLDPVGEISAGGYWIVRSTDHGTTWKGPFCTGLRIRGPYELVICSTLPLIIDNGVRLEVTVNELDESSITFPPVALRTKQAREGIALDLKWEDLERDSDGDGLTDLFEERILTDPNNVDTDGDGIPDAADPLPQVAFKRSSSEEAAVAAVVLEAYYNPSVIVAPRRIESAEARRDENMGPRTIFIVGNPEELAGLAPRMRTIVLNDADLDAASQKFGRILATHMSPIVIDQTGTRAWVEINDEWRGSTYLLVKRNGVWVAQVVGSWVT